MQANDTWLDTLEATLPPAWRESLEQLSAEVLQPERPLRVVLAGAFTVGKSSLINMLTGADWLPAALEETTSLPTFVEHGRATRMALVDADGSERDLSGEEFARVVVQAPPKAAYAVLSLDQDWLVGTVMVDLPGLGGSSQSNREYALAQIQQADMVLYLLPSRGPDAADLGMLSRIRSLGKHVVVLATRWDEAMCAAADGEKLPDLHAWAGQIEAGSGLALQITPVSKDGLGRDAVIRSVREACATLAAIRMRRLRAELAPALDNALGRNGLMQEACHADSEEARRATHAELLARKAALSELKADLHVRSGADRAASEAAARDTAIRHRKEFESTLAGLAASVSDEAQWPEFVAAGCAARQRAFDAVARDMQELSSSYGELRLPEPRQQEFQLRLPPPQALASQDFLDVGRMAALQKALAEKQAEEAGLAPPAGQEATGDGDDEARRLALHAALEQRNALWAEPLPEIEQECGNNRGAVFGRLLGEIADIGVMFVNPSVAGAKVASLVGKGAKIAKITVNTAKVAKAATTSVKVLKASRTGTKVKGVPPAIIDKIGMLEAISFGYWGERIGSAFDGQRAVMVVDPDAQAKQQAALRAADADIQARRSALARSGRQAQEARMSEWARAQNRKEQAGLQADLDALVSERDRRAAQWEALQGEERARLLARHLDQALENWRRSYVHQADAMCDVLRQLVKLHWEQRVDALVDERLAELAELQAMVDAAPGHRQDMLARLQAEASGLQASLRLLAA